MKKTIETTWDSQTGILTTTFQGQVSSQDAAEWAHGLQKAIDGLADNSQFKLLLDLYGFEPENIEAHKAMRNIIPETLARHGLRPAFIDLFDEKPELPISRTRGIQCLAFANVHHDANKMADYKRRIGQPNQQFFSNLEEALNWLKSLK